MRPLLNIRKVDDHGGYGSKMNMHDETPSGEEGRGMMEFKCGYSGHKNRRHSIVKTSLVFTLTGLACFYFNTSHYHPTQPLLNSSYSFSSNKMQQFDELENVLKRAAMEDNRTVIITTLNAAWTEPGSIFYLFLESFRIGNQTLDLLNHLVVVALDHKAHSRCMEIHHHCFPITVEGVDFSEQSYFMSSNYLKMMWARIDFLRSVLEVGYDFIFTDADVLWLRNPFPRFHPKGEGDFQIACDWYKFNSTNLNNYPNGGFNYVQSNNRTIQFYKYWHSSKDHFPGKHDQDVFNLIKFNPFIARIGLRIRFLDTAYFGGFCEASKDLDVVVTMHANCCFGWANKMHDMKMVMEDWNKYMYLVKKRGCKKLSGSWSGPWRCGFKRGG